MNLMSVIVFVACLLLVSGNTVFAVPYLQLDADKAAYVAGDEQSIVTSELEFTLYALVESTKGSTSPIGGFWISAAIIPDPGQSNPAPILGSYKFGGVTFNVATGMEYGIPPIEEFIQQNSLPSHGLFDTYYREHEVDLTPTGYADAYDVQYDWGGPENFPPTPGGGEIWYQAFSVDASGLPYPAYRLHFDFYTKDGDGNIVAFAPFSHDVVATPIPAPVILGILGMGVAGFKLRKYA
jgi:hypothetical protein